MPKLRLAVVAACWLLITLPLRAEEAVDAEALTPEKIEFFEKHVRPVLMTHCAECHGEKRQESDVRVDSRASLLKGNAEGPLIKPGDTDASRLLHVIRYDGDIQMPPEEKLPDDAIAALTEWVKLGAPWPEDAGAAPAGPSKNELAKAHWAFQPVKEPPLPSVANEQWVKTPVDRFVLNRLEQAGLAPASPADRRTLIRRMSLDVTGLPPTPEDVESFVQDQSPGAIDALVDRLLASQHYGERWGRHWLDLARYADTKGYVFQEDRRYPYAYVYRDWVVQALNQDLPYDQFLMQQIAADRLPRSGDDSSLAAMGFLTVGRRFLNNKHDIIDDRIDVVMRTTQGLTVACARCHDHKFDPIPTLDYYSLYGVFDSSEEKLKPIAPPSEEYKKELAAREAKVQEYTRQKRDELLAGMIENLGDYLAAARQPEGQQPAEKLNSKVVERWRKYIEASTKNFHPVFGPWNAFAALPEGEFAAKAPELAAKFAKNDDEKQKVNPLIAKAFQGESPKSFADVVDRYAKVLKEVDTAWRKAQSEATAEGKPAPESLADASQDQIRKVLYRDKAPLDIDDEDVRRLLPQKEREELRKLQEKITEWTGSPAAPKQAMTLEDKSNPHNARVLLRGNPGNAGPEAPRRFLEVISREERKPFQDGSGRLELAQAITNSQNPLTARVMVNRVWVHYFGQGLIDTPSDFGLRTAPPSHPELLDYLAARFMADGWSLKKLHRTILLSSTYQQSSTDNPAARAADPENRLLWKMNRRRLDFEALRDSLLAVSGSLDRSIGGPAAGIATPPYSKRRTIYGYVDRQNLPGVFRMFDFATPDSHSPQRHVTTVPQQALYLMNGQFVNELLQDLAKRPDLQAMDDPNAKIQRLYALAFGRPPRPEELAMGLEYLAAQPADPAKEKLTPWQRYAQVVLMSNEFAHVD